MSAKDLASAGQGNDIRQYWDRLVARLPIVIAAALLGGLGAGLWLYVLPPTYTASTTLSVFPLSTDRYAANRNVANLVDMGAEAVMSSSFRVAEVAVEDVAGEWSAAELREKTTVSAGADSTTMIIKVKAESEARARMGAVAVADAYLQTRSDQAAASINMLVSRDQTRIDEVRESLSTAIARGEAAEAGSTEASRSLADQQIINQQVATLLSRISSLEGIDTTGGVVLNSALVTPIVVQPSRTAFLASGAAVGLIVGVIAAFVLPASRRTMRSPSDISRAFELDTLAFLVGGVASDQDVAAAAQRILRLASLTNARVLAIAFDDAVSWPVTLVERFAVEMRLSGTLAAVAPPERVDEYRCNELVLVPVRADAPEAHRLHALRVSDGTVFVAGVRMTTVKSAQGLVELAKEMGAPVVAVVLVEGAPSEREPIPFASEDSAEASTGDSTEVSTKGLAMRRNR